jgi:D-alanine-D-alanine ligase
MELHVVAFLEMVDIPYSGAGSKTIGITYDKQAVVKVAESIGIPVPKSIYLDEGDSLNPVEHGLAFPVLIKPNSTDGSFGKQIST